MSERVEQINKREDQGAINSFSLKKAQESQGRRLKLRKSLNNAKQSDQEFFSRRHGGHGEMLQSDY